MPTPINRGNIPDALAKLLGIKGGITPLLDETLLPIISVADLLDSPYLQYGSSAGKSGAALAVVGENSVIVATPGPSLALQLQQIMIRNTSAAALDGAFTILTQANIVTAGLAAFSNFVNLAAQPAQLATSSTLLRGSHTSIIGSEVGRFTVPADSSLIIPLPKPGFILYGDDEGGIPGLAVWCETTNTVLEAVTFYGREWPLAI